MRRFQCLSVFLVFLVATCALAAEDTRNFDARIAANGGHRALTVSDASLAAEDALAAEAPGLAVTFDANTGVARNIRTRTGFLTGPHPGARPEDVAREFTSRHKDLLGLTDLDLESLTLTDAVTSEVGGNQHLYFQQSFRGIPVYLGQLQVHLDRDGRVLSVNNAVMPNLRDAANNDLAGVSAPRAVAAAARHLGLEIARPVTAGIQSAHSVRIPGQDLSQDPIDAKLVWLPVRKGQAHLAWNFQIRTLDDQHWYDLTVDAHTGQVWTRVDWTASGTYRVYSDPTESPQHTSPLPPSDARDLVVNPEDSVASPAGWFDAGTTIMDGNNVHACLDQNANNGCDTGEPSCGGSLVCDFAIDLTSAPANSGPAAVTNLFYWNNRIHDIQYQYGFNEAAGNFQEDNFGRGGSGSDSVNADAQDGSGNCNANFSTPPDGSNPRMQMFLCANASPSRDGDYDNAVIVHEYGHGISIRQVGGPSTSSCLGNSQQAGEGWSDWFGLVYTAETGDQGTDQRGLGSYLFALAPNGTIRPQPYSTDPSINNYTYASISGLSIPHGVGSVWAQALWEVHWSLVAKHGFEEDLINFDLGDPAEAGNKRALYYVNEGLKNTACNPTFVDNRDGILQAAAASFGGEDVCTLWESFAAFGLGIDAVSGSSNSTNPTNGFNLPAECGGTSCLPKGASCSANSECCSDKCKGRAGNRTCK